jgi:hypothetical protein
MRSTVLLKKVNASAQCSQMSISEARLSTVMVTKSLTPLQIIMLDLLITQDLPNAGPVSLEILYQERGNIASVKSFHNLYTELNLINVLMLLVSEALMNNHHQTIVHVRLDKIFSMEKFHKAYLIDQSLFQLVKLNLRG